MADPQVPAVIDITSDKIEEVETELRRALDQIARRIGRSAVNHLKEMYPAAMEAVPKNAETSLTNFVRNRINSEMLPLVNVALKHWRETK